MSSKKLLVPEARKALEDYKTEMSTELGVNTKYLASAHTGLITKKLVEMGEKELLNKYK